MVYNNLKHTSQIAEMSKYAVLSEDKAVICFAMYVTMIRFGIRADEIVPLARQFRKTMEGEPDATE